MKTIILAAALLAFGSQAFATDPHPRGTLGTVAVSGSGAFVGGFGTSTARSETGNVSLGHANVAGGNHRSFTASESWGAGVSTGHGAFAGFGSGISGAFTNGRF